MIYAGTNEALRPLEIDQMKDFISKLRETLNLPSSKPKFIDIVSKQKELLPKAEEFLKDTITDILGEMNIKQKSIVSSTEDTEIQS